MAKTWVGNMIFETWYCLDNSAKTLNEPFRAITIVWLFFNSPLGLKYTVLCAVIFNGALRETCGNLLGAQCKYLLPIQISANNAKMKVLLLATNRD